MRVKTAGGGHECQPHQGVFFWRLSATLISTLVFAHECVHACCLLSLDCWSFLGFPQMSWSLEAAVAASPPGQRELLLTSSLFPFSTADSFSLPQSLSWAPNREDSLPKKELTQSGYSLRPWGCMNPLPTLNLTANGSQDFAGFPLGVNPAWL